METYKGIHYFIGNNLGSVEPSDLKTGYRIICIKHNGVEVTLKEFDGPYNTVKELTKKSPQFKHLQKKDPARAQQITDPKYIFDCDLGNCIFTSSNDTQPKDFIQTIQHTIKGTIKKNVLRGIHFFNKEKMQIIQELKKEDQNGIWEAKFKTLNNINKQWIEKQSTFFPKEWDHTRLYHECNYAIDNMTPCENSQYKYKSITPTGIPVEIIIKMNQIVSIYPLYTK
ncbi:MULTISPECIES: EndoU domain-containing protein [Bacteroides]|uniref:EndoU domain-containing protein n=1 Tax=Bacteroides TaxID=816 RepID=UPI00202F1194|nr:MULTISPECIES: EndoU domain-containing protein [Bacteroides]MCM0301271.1 EndoU domain-containing protein [Bacteroides fragilis]MCM0315929.1 EndoU domain-containing protein [Bacteroides fragilis]MDV6195448.1 EndoU domain-containing protein [Bacteroides hominis (ex Liu et al. 2022)]